MVNEGPLLDAEYFVVLQFFSNLKEHPVVLKKISITVSEENFLPKQNKWSNCLCFHEMTLKG